jgi:osmotically-inducible protein OsmY
MNNATTMNPPSGHAQSRSARPRTCQTARQRAFVLALLGLGVMQLAGCAVVAVGGVAAGTTLAATDRRTTGTLLEDQLIEFKARNRAREILPDSGNVSATSFNRVLLLTGEVPTEANRLAMEQTAAQIDNVRSVVNELAVRETSTFTSRSSDTVVTGKVKATLTDARVFPVNAVKVVTERGNVYLMGLVSEAEGNRAAELTRSVGGVMRVVKVFETNVPASDASGKALTPAPGGAPAAPGGAPAASTSAAPSASSTAPAATPSAPAGASVPAPAR